MSEADGRRLSLFDCIGIGINGIIGSGIFVLPKLLASAAGPASIAAFLVCGLLCVLVGLCFGEMAGIAAHRSGGPYRFARLAFGETAGFAVGWIAVASGVIGYAAVARALSERIVALTGADPTASPMMITGAASAIIAGLAAVNYVGLRAGARLSDLLSIAKLVPLGLLVVVGLPSIELKNLSPFLPAESAGLLQAVWYALFACAGFEYVSVPSGETRNPQRDVPRAIFWSVMGATILYCLVQLVAIGTYPGIRDTWTPLEATASHLLGPAGRWTIAVGAVISMLGFCSGSALVGPRFVHAFASDGLLPAPFATLHAKFQTPGVAIVASSGAAIVLTSLLGFRSLVDFSNLAIVAQYVATCLAVLVLRRTQPGLARSYRVPLGPVIPVVSIVLVVGLVAFNIETKELTMGAAVMVVGGVLYAVARRFVRPSVQGA